MTTEVTLKVSSPEELKWIGKLLERKQQLEPNKELHTEWKESLVRALSTVEDRTIRHDLSEILLVLMAS